MNGDQLNAGAWFLEEEKRTQISLSHILRVYGSFAAEKNPTYNFFNGYLSGLGAMLK